jgi:DNA-binding transcriptional MerR regulator
MHDTSQVKDEYEFTAKEVAYVIRANPRTIIDWGGRGLVQADIYQSKGQGSRNVYSVRNVVQMRVVQEFLHRGLTRSQVKNLFDWLERTRHAVFQRGLFDPDTGAGKDPRWVYWLNRNQAKFWGVMELSSDRPPRCFPHAPDQVLRADSLVTVNVGQLKQEIMRVIGYSLCTADTLTDWFVNL